MSTIPEIVAAHHSDMKTLCLSLITNKVVMEGDEGAPVATHAEVLEAVEQRSAQMQELVKQIVATMKTEFLPKLPNLSRVSHHVPLKAKRTFYESFEEFEDEQNEAFRWSNIVVGCALVGAGALVGFLAHNRRGR